MNWTPRRTVVALATLAMLIVALAVAPSAGAATLPSGFEAQTVFSSLKQPVDFRFAPDGRVFVSTKGGKIWVYDSINDPTPTLFADLSKPVYDFEDHGLLGIALDPQFNLGRPYVYALYPFNHALEDHHQQQPKGFEPHTKAPLWPSKPAEIGGDPNYEGDYCQETLEVKEKLKPIEEKGCEVSGVLVRLTANGDEAVTNAGGAKEEVLLEGWCQQSTTHAPGDLGFGPEGALFVSGGEGAMYEEPDHGQFGNVCEDPLDSTLPEWWVTSEGGSLRSQSVLRDHTDAAHSTLLSGALLRIDPNTGAGWPGNPFAAEPEPNAKRIFAFGYRNPWRFIVSPRNGSIFLSNVGNAHYEEMDRIPLSGAAPFNSGWPCYEGGPGGVSTRNDEYSQKEPATVDVCKQLFEAEDAGHPQTKPPFFSYEHNGPVVPGDPCLGHTTDIAGLALYEGNDYPAAYRSSLFFADAIRGCIYVMRANAECEPDPSSVSAFVSGNAPFSFPGVDIEQGPEGNIYYAEFGTGPAGGANGAIKRIVYNGPREPEPPNGGGPACRHDTGGGSGAGGGAGASGGGTPTQTYSPPKLGKRPGKRTASRSAKFAFGTPGAPRFQCRIDKKKWASCRSPRTYKRLALGTHTFRVRAADAGGAPLTKATVYGWRIVAG
jgi:glucose/arabinose dehydrogenase